jgi:hypothetical protein
MKKYVILISSILLIAFGYLIEDRGLAAQVTSSGEILYPISSGSDDGFILKQGLYLFAITSFYSAISIIRDHRELTLFIVYSVNSLIYAFFLFLVMLDSSIIEAAKLGDWHPLTANIIWILSFAIYGALSLNKSSQPTQKSGTTKL